MSVLWGAISCEYISNNPPQAVVAGIISVSLIVFYQLKCRLDGLKIGQDVRPFSLNGVDKGGDLVEEALGVNGVAREDGRETVVTVQVLDRLTTGTDFFHRDASNNWLSVSKNQLLALIQTVGARRGVDRE